jgi:integrase
MPGFWKALAEDDTVKGDATRFMILTAARSREALGATWDEIDLEQRVWTIPAAAHEDAARASGAAERSGHGGAGEAPGARGRRADAGLVFPGANGKPLHRSVPKVIIQQLRGTTETAHGCRSTFADWCRVVAKADPEARELALAHQIGNATTRAYSRDDLLEPRRPLMEAWANFLAS